MRTLQANFRANSPDLVQVQEIGKAKAPSSNGEIPKRGPLYSAAKPGGQLSLFP